MEVARVEIIAEEPSMEAALRALLPRILGKTPFEIYPFQCKDELLARLPARLSGYARWLPDEFRIVVVVDRDDDDCKLLKAKLDQIAADAHLKTRSTAGRGNVQIINRIVVEELEGWYFGDWEAVAQAYPRVSNTIPQQAKYRDPEAIRGGAWEALERILQRAGYFEQGLRKIEVARAVAARIDPCRNSSRSFQHFIQAIMPFAS
jgi:hypothetical protein